MSIIVDSDPSTADGWATDDLVYIWKSSNAVQIGKVSLPRFVV